MDLKDEAKPKTTTPASMKELNWEKIERAASAVDRWPAFMKGTAWQPAKQKPDSTQAPKAKAKAACK